MTDSKLAFKSSFSFYLVLCVGVFLHQRNVLEVFATEGAVVVVVVGRRLLDFRVTHIPVKYQLGLIGEVALAGLTQQPFLEQGFCKVEICMELTPDVPRVGEKQ